MINLRVQYNLIIISVSMGLFERVADKFTDINK